MDRNRWIIFAVVCIGIVVGLVALPGKDKIDVSKTDPTKIDTISPIADHVIGKADSNIVVIEYADFQCPGCTAAFPQIKAVTDSYKSSIAFVYRNFPLTSAHQHAFAAAATAESAGLQGKYWEMHDMLFQNHETWSVVTPAERDTIFEGYASQLGLNLTQFRSDLSSQKVADKINTDRALGTKSGVDSTPTLYLNGAKIESDIVTDLMQNKGDKLRDKLDALIRQSGGTPPARVTTQ